jgi:hypothetical protein
MLPVASALCGWRLTEVGSRCFPRPLWPGKQGVAFLAGDTIEAAFAVLAPPNQILGLWMSGGASPRFLHPCGQASVA